MCETNFSLHKHYVSNPNGEAVSKCVPKLVSKFHNDPTVDEFEIIFLLGQVLSLYEKRESYDEKDISLTPDIVLKIPTVRMRKKEKVLGEEEGKTK